MSLPNLSSFLFRVILGLVGQQPVVNYIEPATSQAAGTFQQPVVIAQGAMNQAVNLATLFPALTAANTMFLVVQEISATPEGFNIAASASDPGFSIRPGSIFAAAINSLPTLYFDQTNALGPVTVMISVTGS